MDELIDIVDETGRVLWQAGKHEAHVHGWLHATVIGCLRRANGDWTLVRQSADRQDAGQLVAPVGGHVRAGEAELDALLREAEEEVGTRNIRHKLVGRARFHRQVIGRNENHLFIVYEFDTDDDLMLGPEAEALESFTHAAFQQALADTPMRFGDAHHFVLEQFFPEYLPSNWQYRWK